MKLNNRSTSYPQKPDRSRDGFAGRASALFSRSDEPGIADRSYARTAELHVRTGSMGSRPQSLAPGAVTLAGGLACIARGTRIASLRGDIPVENLRRGDKIITRGVGALPLRWIGSCILEQTRPYSLVLIRAGALGNHDDLLVTPDHRILINDATAGLLCGSGQLLVPARSLINNETILGVTGHEIEVWGLLFDEHQVIYANGAMIESLYLPGGERNDNAMAAFPELKQGSPVRHQATAAPEISPSELVALTSVLGINQPVSKNTRRAARKGGSIALVLDGKM